MKKFTKNLFFFFLAFIAFPALPSAQMAIYKGGVNKLSGPWAVNCTVATTTSNNPHEGTDHYNFTYKVNSPGYAGFGFGFNGASIDFSAYTHLRIAYKSQNAGQNFLLYLKNAQGLYAEFYSLPHSATYKVVDIPLDYYAPVCSGFDMSKITELVGAADGSASGTIYFDAIELVTKTVAPVSDNDAKPSLAGSAKVWNRTKKIGYSLSLEIWNGGSKTAPPTKQQIVNMAQSNVKSIRCVIGFETLMDTIAPYALKLNHVAYGEIDSLIKWTGQYNMALILDNHIGYEVDDKIGKAYWTDKSYLKDQARVTAMWKQLAQRYKNIDHERVFFELKNEPGINQYGLGNHTLRKINNSVIDAVRLIDKERTLVVTSSGYSPVDSLVLTRPYNDDNLIYTFHSYDPGEFTYQGFTWFWNDKIDIPFPKSGDVQKLQCLYGRAKDWSKKWNVPIINGEFGVSGRSEPDSRCRYMKTICTIMDSLAIPACYFAPDSYYYGFGFYKDATYEYNKSIPCFADALHYKKPDVIYPSTRAIYKAGKTEIVNFWKHELDFQEVTTDNPLEGGQHYKITYPANTSGWRGGGIQFHNAWAYNKPPLDFTEGNYTHLKLSYRGLPTGQKVTMSLVYNFMMNLGEPQLTPKTKESNTFTLDVNSNTYTTIEIPLESLKNNIFKGFWFVSGISLYVNNPTQAGSFYLDNIELVNKNATSDVFESKNEVLEGVKVYPNPTSDLLFVEIDNEAIAKTTLLDMTGKVLLQKNIQQTDNLDLSNLPKGVYLLKIEVDSKVAFRKIVVN